MRRVLVQDLRTTQVFLPTTPYRLPKGTKNRDLHFWELRNNVAFMVQRNGACVIMREVDGHMFTYPSLKHAITDYGFKRSEVRLHWGETVAELLSEFMYRHGTQFGDPARVDLRRAKITLSLRLKYATWGPAATKLLHQFVRRVDRSLHKERGEALVSALVGLDHNEVQRLFKVV